MKNMFNAQDRDEMLARIDALQSNSVRQWGKMQPAQMLAHVSASFETALDQKRPPRLLIGYFIGPLFKSQFTNERHFGKNAPTDPSFVVSDERDMEKERTRLKQLVNEFYAGGPEKCTRHPHVFFGKFTPDQWARGMYKHLDHHLRQFGV